MSTANRKHHAEWFSLIEVAGPFLTLPVLERVFPQGLDKDDSPEAKEHARNLRLAFEEWEDNQSGHRPNPVIHKAWIDFVFKQTLGFSKDAHPEFDETCLAEGQKIPQTLMAMISNQRETLRPDVVVRNPEGVPNTGKARLLVQIYPIEQNLEKAISGRHWNASPATRMMELLHATDVRLGLLTNGEQWMLVDAPRNGTTGFASWYATLWFEEPLTLRAFRSLLRIRRFFSVAEDETLEAMLAESATHQKEVTEQLGLQVRRAVEVLIQSLDRADKDDKVLAGVPETVLYEAALTVMMRLVFLFSAEERELLLLGDPLFDQHYAVSTLVAQLQEAADNYTEDVLERRKDAWVRLLSTFRAVFGGVQHERMRLLAYAGNLFNPDRFPFLEGRKPGTTWRDTNLQKTLPVPVNNRTVLHLLRALQYLQGEHKEDPAVRLSFQSLNIEQIGHVYEGLLDHTAKRATEPMLSLGGAKEKETEVALAELERLHDKGKTHLLQFLNEVTSRQEKTLKRLLELPLEGEDAKKLRAVCGNDEKLFQRVLPFSGLLRNDTFDRPVVIRKGSVYVTAGTDRRSSGTHYTPPELTEPIVRYTLEPLVYVGPAEGKSEAEWKLRSAKDLLDLKICDMACGSGAFLVQVCRYLSERLLEAWEQCEEEAQIGHQESLFEKKERGSFPITRITPFGLPSMGGLYENVLPLDLNERKAFSQRLVAQRCLYGVDKNPLAVEMAKLSLWLLTLAKYKPFTFLDHAIRCGDSLVGIRDLQQLENLTMSGEKQFAPAFLESLQSSVRQAIQLRQQLESCPANDIQAVQEQERLFAEVSRLTAKLGAAADLLLADAFRNEDQGIVTVVARFRDSTPEALQAEARKQLNGQPTLHWPLEFPEVLVDRGGFDAFVCNPPFMGGKKITGNLGDDYREYLVAHLASGQRGHADLCAYFFLRASLLLRDSGQLGFLATNTIAQGDTREVGLEQLTAKGYVIPRAVPSRPWPGTASLEVAHIWMRRGAWNGPFVLNDRPATGITAFLTQPAAVSGNPYRLKANESKSFIGSYVLGMGFVLSAEEAERLIEKDPRNKDVVFLYLNGEDLNSRPDQSPSRWVINFFDWALEKAAEYPDCLRIIEEKVKPERTRTKEKGEFVLRKPLPQKWWIYADKRPELYRTIAGMKRVLARSRIANMNSWDFVPTRIVCSEQTVLVASDTFDWFTIMQNSLQTAWIVEYASSMRTDVRYTPTDCFETFPFPALMDLDAIGKRYHDHRRQIMLARQVGLTKTYNRFHNPEDENADIQKLRELHIEMDRAVAAAYGWNDLDLDDDFHETKQGVRFTISEPARREVLARLLKLNHERYAEEVKQGLHEKKGKTKRPSSGGGRKSSPPAGGKSLFDECEEDPPPAATAKEHKRVAEEPASRPTPIDELDTDDIMAAFRQATRGRGSLERDELLKEVSVALGYQRLGPKIEEALRGHLRAAIRRRIIEADGASNVRAGTGTMADYGLDELRETFRSVMRKGTKYEREDVIHALARYLGFARVTDTSRDAIKSAINSAIRQGILGYEGSVVWREE